MTRTLRVNFKQYYQNRLLWLIYIWSLSLVGPWIMLTLDDGTKAYRLMYLIISLVAGVITGNIQLAILAKPLAFCLPGHRQIPRRFIFITGVPLSILLGVSFLTYPNLLGLEMLLTVTAAILLGLTSFLGGVYAALYLKNQGTLIGLIVFFAYALIFVGVPEMLMSLLVNQPAGLIIACSLICIIAWLFMGREIDARRFCQKTTLSMFDFWNKDKVKRYQLERIAEKEQKNGKTWCYSATVESFFIKRIRSCPANSGRKYILGTIYQFWGPWLSNKGGPLGVLIGIFFLAICLGYMRISIGSSDGGGLFIVFIISAMFTQAQLGVFSHTLTLGGRPRRFANALTLAFMLVASVASIILILITANRLIAPVMPELVYHELKLGFKVMSFGSWYYGAIFIPLFLAVSLFFPKNKVLLMVVLMIILMPLLALGFYWTHRHGLVSPWFTAPVIIPAWLVFFATLKHFCRKRDLVLS
jgi:hypothetical protein